MAAPGRALRVASLIRETLSEILLKEVSDPGIGFVTVTEVSCSSDLRNVRAYVSILGDKEAKEKTWKALGRARGHIESLLAPRIRLRYAPKLDFAIDDSPARAARVSGLLAGTVAPEKGDDE